MTVVLNTTGRFEEASQHGARAVSLYDREQDRETAHLFGHDQGVGALCHLAIALTFLEDIAEAKATATRAADLACSLNNANTLLYNALWSSFISVASHDWTQAQETSAEMVAEAEKRSMALWAVFGRHFLGCSLVGFGAPEAGLAELHRGRSDAVKLDNRIFLPITLSFEAQGLAAAGQHDEALTQLAEALRVIGETQELWWEAEVHRIQGEIMWPRGARPPNVKENFAERSRLPRQGAKLLERRARASMERLLELGRGQDRVA